MPPFYGWGSTVSRLEGHYKKAVLPLFTTKFSDIPGAHLIDPGRMKG